MYYSYVYLTINQLENKIYVGKKFGLPEKSKSYLGSGKILKRKIKIYGKKFFKKIILGILEAETLEELDILTNEAEIESVWLFRAYGSDGEHHDHIYGYNLTRGGDGTFGISNDCIRQRVEKTKKLYEINPEKKKKEVEKRLENEKINPEIKIKRSQTRNQTLKKDPLIMIGSGQKISNTYWNKSDEKKQEHKNNRKKTLNENPEIQISSSKKCSMTWNNKTEEEKKEIILRRKAPFEKNPEIINNAKIKRMETTNNDPSIMENANIKRMETMRNKSIEEKKQINSKISKSRVLNKSGAGKNHPFYKLINYEFLIINYFLIIGKTALIKKYNLIFDDTISTSNFDRFLKILNLPLNCLGKTSNKTKTQTYLKFVEENKHKIQWYIDNYERLENEYWDKLHYERHPELLLVKIS